MLFLNQYVEVQPITGGRTRFLRFDNLELEGIKCECMHPRAAHGPLEYPTCGVFACPCTRFQLDAKPESH